MPNYQLGKVYELTSIHTNEKYIGSTCEKYLSGRLGSHVRTYKRYLAGKSHFVRSFDILKYGDYQINLVESFPCENNDELLARERYWIHNTDNCINRNIPGRTGKEYYEAEKERIKEYQAGYRATNRELIRVKDANRYQANKESLRVRRAAIYLCEICNSSIRVGDKAKHEKTKKHLACLE